MKIIKLVEFNFLRCFLFYWNFHEVAATKPTKKEIENKVLTNSVCFDLIAISTEILANPLNNKFLSLPDISRCKIRNLTWCWLHWRVREVWRSLIRSCSVRQSTGEAGSWSVLEESIPDCLSCCRVRSSGSWSSWSRLSWAGLLGAGTHWRPSPASELVLEVVWGGCWSLILHWWSQFHLEEWWDSRTGSHWTLEQSTHHWPRGGLQHWSQGWWQGWGRRLELWEMILVWSCWSQLEHWTRWTGETWPQTWCWVRRAGWDCLWCGHCSLLLSSSWAESCSQSRSWSR